MDIKKLDLFITKSIDDSQHLMNLIRQDRLFLDSIKEISLACCRSIENRGKIIFAGNGGSACDAQHFATELMVRFSKNRAALPAIALNSDSTLITACSNDFGFEMIFTRQLEGIATENDLFFGISTSGKSKNILSALKFARSKGIHSVFLTGSTNPDIHYLCDHIIKVPSENTARIQEMHSLCGHIICAIIENYFFE